MKPFVAPLEDILFSLNEFAGTDRIPGWDADITSDIAGHFVAFAEGEIAPLDEPGDVQGCRLENGRVRMPDGFAQVYQAYVDQGWPGLVAPEIHGGQGMGAAVQAITSEIFSGACHSFQMVTGLGPGAMRTIKNFGAEDQQNRWLPKIASGEYLATMCLTEPGAGSDLSAIRCKAVEDGAHWKINGEKIFISGGDQNISKGILHLVLARTSDDGIRGLSLFLCSSIKSDETLNEIAVTRIEEKMGLHASPTCHLTFDGAEGELIGHAGEGLKAMFTMMNHARLDVSLQGVAHAARAHDIAATYAAERVQGRGRDGKPATLDQHLDVRRMLDEMDALAVGSRAIVHLSVVIMETGENTDLVDFLTPIAKVFCTEAGMKAAELGMQVLGGYGYLREYRIEQTYRDARITAIYEGANGIHASALANRGLQSARSSDAFFECIKQIAEDSGEGALLESMEHWSGAREIVRAASDPTVFAHEFMQLSAQVLYLAVWVRLNTISRLSPDPARYANLAEIVIRTLPHDILATSRRLISAGSKK